MRSEVDDTASGMQTLYQAGDIFLDDRGYRNVVSYLTDCGYVCRKPPCLKSEERQLGTADANEARLVITIQKWVI